MPVIFTLTGYTGTGEWIMDYSLMNDVADTAGFLAVYPEPIQPGWNSGIIDRPTPSVNDVGFLTELIDTLHVRYDIDISRVYCCGFSNGAHMTQRLAYWAGHRFAAVGSICGTMTDSTAVQPPAVTRFMPILILNGTADPALPYPGGTPGKFAIEDMLNFWVQNNNCALNADTSSLPDLDPIDGCTVDKICYTNCSDEVQVLFYKVIYGGHAWPGGDEDVWGGNGNMNMDISSSAEMWNFFKNYTIPDSILGIKNNYNNKPEKFSLVQNYPNPFNPSTTIQFQIPKSQFTTLKVYNILGKEVYTIVSRKLNPGNYTYTFDGKSLASGIYYYHLTAGEYKEVKKMILSK
jgi:polyhydroxybutyrate depolymerase